MLTLDAISIGESAQITGFYEQAIGFRQKLLAMGLTPGTVIKVLRIAPLGDPFQIQLRGYTISLRKKECQRIEVIKIKNQSCVNATDVNATDKTVVDNHAPTPHCPCR